MGERQAEVLADDDPEALHQLPVALRRLRTALGQFGPALELPKGVTERRIAQVAERTGRCRDLDVLRLRLREQILPRLPSQEQAKLHGALRTSSTIAPGPSTSCETNFSVPAFASFWKIGRAHV